jgi:hypothetical protein
VVGDGALRALERGRQLGDRGRALVEQAEDGVAERVAERLDLRGLREPDPVGEVVVRGRRFGGQTNSVVCSN